MSVQLLVLLLALKVKDQNLVGTSLADDLAHDLGIVSLGDRALFAADCQDFEINVLVAVDVFSIFTTSPGATRYCLPPARITAYIDMPPYIFSPPRLCETRSTPLARPMEFPNQICALALPRKSSAVDRKIEGRSGYRIAAIPQPQRRT